MVGALFNGAWVHDSAAAGWCPDGVIARLVSPKRIDYVKIPSGKRLILTAG
jgi:hypothetical protein